MHIKTNIEHSSVQIIVLAICPLLFVVSTVNEAMFFVCGTVICLLISQLFMLIFNKYLTNNVKSMLTAIISTMLVTVSILLVDELTDKTMPANSYFIIFSATVLSSEFNYFRNKAVSKHYFFSIFKILFIFALMTFVYAAIKEFLAFGSVYGKQLFAFSGVEFCRLMIFNLLLLATLCAGFDHVVRTIDKNRETKNMVYQKYVKIIRSEKAFQYDILRREKLLTNEIEVNKINKVDAEKIAQKESENEAIESVKEVIAEESEIAELVEDEELKVENPDINVDSSSDNGKTKKKKKRGGE